MGTFQSANDFQSRSPIQFYSLDNPALSICAANSNLLYNNPKLMRIKMGSAAKLNFGLNGTSYIMGDGEFSPFAIELSWDQLGYNDYLNLVALRNYTITFVSFRGNGYLGKLIFDGPESNAAQTADVIKLNATFLCLGPSDNAQTAGINAINRIADPTTLAAANSGTYGTGFIPGNGINYYWLTYSSIWGETNPQQIGPIQAAATANPGGSPTLSLVSGGALGSRTGFAKITIVYPSGETLPNTEATLAITASHILQVTSPASVPGALGYNVYTSTTTGTETLQNTSTIPFGTNWIEPTTGMISSGPTVPIVNNARIESTYNTISFQWPTGTSFCTLANLYVSNINDPTQSRLLAQLINGDLPVWNDLVGFAGTTVVQQPPSASTAYRGFWQGGVWANETP